MEKGKENHKQVKDTLEDKEIKEMKRISHGNLGQIG